MLKYWLTFLSIFFVISFTIQSCTKDDGTSGNTNDPNKITDEDLFEKANNKTGFQYYKNITDTLTSASNSGHKPYVLIRFNEIALNELGADGKLPGNKTFPNGSVIVKEIYKTKGGKLDHIAVMMKKPDDKNSEADWVWAEYEVSGNAKISVVDKGSQCINCHKGNGNRDLVLTFANH